MRNMIFLLGSFAVLTALPATAQQATNETPPACERKGGVTQFLTVSDIHVDSCLWMDADGIFNEQANYRVGAPRLAQVVTVQKPVNCLIVVENGERFCIVESPRKDAGRYGPHTFSCTKDTCVIRWKELWELVG